MKAAVLKGPQKIIIEDRQIPVPLSDDVLIRIRAVGICGSDIQGFLGKIPNRRPVGLIMGHEAAGEVVETGEKISIWKEGDRVVIDPIISCGDCYFCRRGWGNLCENIVNVGSAMRKFRDGAMSEYFIMPSRHVHKLPDNLSFEEGALVEPTSCAIHILNRTDIKVGSTVAVFGTGTIGLILINLLRLMGALRIICVDIQPYRLKLAREIGADICINSEVEDPVERIIKETSGRGADIAIEAAGYTTTYGQCLNSIRKRGQILALGFSDPEPFLMLRKVIYREITLIGCSAYWCESETALRLLGQKKINTNKIITHKFSLDDVQEAFETTVDPSKNSIKVMLLP